ncbi:MAG: M48 family metalloprotease [Gemmatimonadetes bacterium]|nr:M48 family metalloprotease [Gemmatimonadota bacterium]
MTSGIAKACAVTTTLLVGACVVNPATGERQFILIGEGREIAMGREADRSISASLGTYDDPSLQTYLSEIGNGMASLSERPNLPWSFKVMDDPIVNAFALPGGFIYITRGIMAHFNSEAQLASVVGHEIGHVTGRHSVEQLSRAQLAQAGLVAGQIFGPQALQGLVGAAGAGLGLLFLKFGRSDERQADDLGLRYMYRAGYDPREMPDVFAMLGSISTASERDPVPEWLSTHPNPENREQRIELAIAELGTDFRGRVVGRDSYLDRLDGMVFGPDPRDGYFDGARFFHPRLRFRLTFPDGWQTQNQRQAVAGINPDQNTMIQLALASQATPDAALDAFLSQDGITHSNARRTSINGLRAATADFRVTVDRTTLAGSIAYVTYDGRVYQLLGYGTTAGWRANRDVAQRSVGTFGELRDRKALAVQPLRLDIVTLPRPMTLEEFSRRYPSEIPLERMALINQFDVGETIPAGTKLKRVIR